MCDPDPVATSFLLELIDTWRVADQRTDAETARRVGISRAALSLMRSNGIKALPNRSTLEGIAATTGQPYSVVLVAALRDTGYLDHPADLVDHTESQ